VCLDHFWTIDHSDTSNWFACGTVLIVVVVVPVLNLQCRVSAGRAYLHKFYFVHFPVRGQGVSRFVMFAHTGALIITCLPNIRTRRV
jgi:hypothetical protein